MYRLYFVITTQHNTLCFLLCPNSTKYISPVLCVKRLIGNTNYLLYLIPFLKIHLVSLHTKAFDKYSIIESIWQKKLLTYIR